MQLKPNYDSPHTNLAYALSASGYSPESLAAVRAAIHLESDDVYLYDYLGFHLLVQADENKDQDRWDAAAAAFQQAIDIDPVNPYARRCLAKTKWVRGKKRVAVKILKDAVAVNPNDAQAYIQLWNYQSRALHFRGMVRTTYAIEELPEAEALNEHYADINRLWPQTQRTLFLVAELAAALAGAWVWNRRR